MASQVTCLSCKQALSAEEFVNACTSWFADVDCVQFNCPRCSKPSDIQLENGRLIDGYLYYGGGPHFSAQAFTALPGLTVEKVDGGLKITLDQITRTLPYAR